MSHVTCHMSYVTCQWPCLPLLSSAFGFAMACNKLSLRAAVQPNSPRVQITTFPTTPSGLVGGLGPPKESVAMATRASAGDIW